MTLAERLRVLEQSIRDEGHREFANELQALADEVDGKVLVKPEVNSNGPHPVVAYIVDTEITGSGATADEATADLQRKWDELGG